MTPAVRALLDRVKGKVDEADFAARMEKARAEFDGLLDDEALALLVLDELGLNEGAYVTLADLKGRAEATVRVTVDRIEPPREFQREGRPAGRVCNVLVSDATGEARMTLWDRDVEKAEDGTLSEGARVTLVNARVKDSKWGTELHVTPWTVIEVEGALDPAKRKLLMDVQGSDDALSLALRKEEDLKSFQARLPAGGPLMGTLASVSPTRTYRKADGSVGFVCDVEVDAGEGRVRVTLWDDLVRDVRKVQQGSPVILEGLVAKARGAAMEWHSGAGTKLRAPPQ